MMIVGKELTRLRKASGRLSSTALAVLRMRTILWKAASSKSLSRTSKTTKIMPSARSSSALTKSKERIVSPTSTVLTSLPTSYDPLCANGSHLLRPTSPWRQPMTIFYAYSRSLSPRDVPTRSRRPHTLVPPRFALSGKRWPKLCNGRPRAVLFPSLRQSSSLRLLAAKSRRQHRESIPSSM